MIDNEFAYELSDEQAERFDFESIISLVDMRQSEPISGIRTQNSVALQEANEAFDRCLIGVSVFRLSSKKATQEAHVDTNLAAPTTSRNCAINIKIGPHKSFVEWYTANDPELRNHYGSKDYALHYFDLKNNTLRFSIETVRPILIDTNLPHLGYSIPQGGLLASLSFTKSFDEMRLWLKASLFQ